MICELCKESIELACGDGIVSETPCGCCEPQGTIKYWHTYCYARRYITNQDIEIIELKALKRNYERIIQEALNK